MLLFFDQVSEQRDIMKKIVMVTLLLIVGYVGTNICVLQAMFEHGYPTKNVKKLIRTDKEGKAKGKQTIQVIVRGQKIAIPKIIWTQGDSEWWEATDAYGTQVKTTTHWSGQIGYPIAACFPFKLYISKYKPSAFEDSKKNKFHPRNVTNIQIDNGQYTKCSSYTYEGNDNKLKCNKKQMYVQLAVITGYPNTPNRSEVYSQRLDGKPKRQLHYYTPVLLTYVADVFETKELTVHGVVALKRKSTAQMKAEITTSEHGSKMSKRMDVSGAADRCPQEGRIQWRTSNAHIATVDQRGMVTGQADGQATITALWRNGPYYIWNSAVVRISSEKRSGPTPLPMDEQDGEATIVCTPVIEPPREVKTIQHQFMDPRAGANVLADGCSNTIHFDATRGIPTSEYLYANAWGSNYLFQYSFAQQQGKVTYYCQAKVTYPLKWKKRTQVQNDPKSGTSMFMDEDQTDRETRNYCFSFSHDYCYWTINELQVYGIKQAHVRNYALPGGSVILTPQSYSSPSIEMEHNEEVAHHVLPQETTPIRFKPKSVCSSGYIRPSPPDDTFVLQKLVQAHTDTPYVRNDGLEFTWNDEFTQVMDGNMVKCVGKCPTAIPQPPPIRSYLDTKEDTMYEDKLLISNHIMNKHNTSIYGTIQYERVPVSVGYSEEIVFYPIEGMNTVTVHTPIVNNSSVSDDRLHNQKTNPSSKRSALILERKFCVAIPTTGQHLSMQQYPGYGNRSYQKYTRQKQICFPFDVYDEHKNTFIPKNTWCDVDIDQQQKTFYLPVWVQEGNYSVKFRNIAINAPSSYSCEHNANMNLTHHAAEHAVEVEVIGRLYDFRITDVADYDWECVFRQEQGQMKATGVSYWVGAYDIDGHLRGNRAPYNLPIRPGSHPFYQFKNKVVNTGYHIKFDLKTKGNMFSLDDGIRIKPTFFFISKDGKRREEVDLYYHRSKDKLIQIGSPQDQEKRYVVLNERLRNVPNEQLIDTASYDYTYHVTSRQRNKYTLNNYVQHFCHNISKQKTSIGGYDWIILPCHLRTFIGPKRHLPIGVDVARALASIQCWYGQYSLPQHVYAVKKGLNLHERARTQTIDEHADVFLRHGYIIVNFHIETIRGGKVSEPHLQYIHAPCMNQWKLEGFQNSHIDPNTRAVWKLKDGDIIFYDAKYSSLDDFMSQVTH